MTSLCIFRGASGVILLRWRADASLMPRNLSPLSTDGPESLPQHLWSLSLLGLVSSRLPRASLLLLCFLLNVPKTVPPYTRCSSCYTAWGLSRFPTTCSLTSHLNPTLPPHLLLLLPPDQPGSHLFSSCLDWHCPVQLPVVTERLSTCLFCPGNNH